MTTTTRRKALASIAALPALAAAPAVADAATDAALFAAAERFTNIYGEHLAIERDHKAFRASVEADIPLPRYDENLTSEEGLAAHLRWQEHMEKRGVWASSDRWNETSEAAGAAAKAVFSIPATTVAGVLVKAEILRLARGEDNDPNEADDALASYDGSDGQAPWIDIVLADLRNIAGRATT